jgi:hypothetical protein
MAFSIVRSLFDVLRERDEEERDRQEVRQQASFFRRFGRMGEAERAANLFPLGMDYERARLEDTGLRPNRFVQQLREEPLPDYQAMAFRGEELPPSFQPIEAPQPLVPPGPTTAEEAFAQFQAGQTVYQPDLPPEELQQFEAMMELSAAVEAERPRTPEEMEAMNRFQPEVNYPTSRPFFVNQAMRLLGEPSLEEQQARFEQPMKVTDPGSYLRAAQFLIEPQAQPDSPLLETLGQVPVAGPALRREAEFMTSPVGAVGSLAFPGQALAGIGGGIAAGTAAEPLPIPEVAKGGIQAAGNILAPGAGLIAGPRLRPTRIDMPLETAQGARLQPEAVTRPVGAAEELPEAARPAVQVAEEAPEAVEEAAPAVAGGAELPGREKLGDILGIARRARGETQALVRTEKQRRAGLSLEALKSDLPTAEAFQQSRRALAGKLPVKTFEHEYTSPDELFAWRQHIREAADASGYDPTRADEAFWRMMGGEPPGKADIQLLRRIFGFDTQGAKSPSWVKKAIDEAVSVFNLPRAIQAAADFSAPLRQGILLIGHPKEWGGNFKPMFKAFFSDEYARAVQEEMLNGKNADLLRRHRVQITELSGTAKLSAREEAFATRWASKIPLVRRSEQAFVTYLNKLRHDVFMNNYATFQRMGMEGDELAMHADELSRMVNIFSGRGELNAIGEWLPALNTVFFSPRLLLSRVQAPMMLASKSKHVRRLALRDFGAFMATGLGTLGMAKLAAEAFEDATGRKAPFSIEMDPRSTDFAKMKMGPTRLDFWGGYQPLVRYAAQIATRQRKTGGGDIIDADVMTSMGRFLQSKLSPGAGFVADVLRGETFLGEEISADPESIKSQAYNRLTPLFLQDMVDAIREGDMLSPILAAPAAFGASSMTYRTFTEETAAKIAEDFETGKLDVDRYDKIPTRMSDLLPTDKEAFKAAHPEVVEKIEEFERGDDERSRYFGQIEVGKERLHSELDRIGGDAQVGGFGNMDEQDSRSSFWNAD